MLWTNLLRQLTGEARLEEAAEQAAANARHAVWDRVRRQIGSMGRAEARGYVRARSAVVVHREIDRLIQQDEGFRAGNRTRLIELTTESLIRVITDQVVFARVALVPRAEPVLLRRAA